MRQAMAEAEVGDDVYGEDPTVNRLEQRAAERSGKEAAIFVPTGTMGNTIAIKLHTQHGQEVLCDSRAHLLDWELAMVAWFSGCVVRALDVPDGILTWDILAPRIKPLSQHAAPTGCIEIENTHNMAGGRVYPLDTIEELCEGAHAEGLAVHMDGARVFNAAEALGVPVARVVRDVDTVMFCLSKALGAPVGSMLAGTRAQIDRARLLRKRLGGGMRQAGVLAAAIQDLPGVSLGKIETNIVIFDISATGKVPAEVSRALKTQGVLMNGVDSRRMRAVTHYDVTHEQCLTAAAAVRAALA
jgi:threonine aldolase